MYVCVCVNSCVRPCVHAGDGAEVPASPRTLNPRPFFNDCNRFQRRDSCLAQNPKPYTLHPTPGEAGLRAAPSVG